MNDLLVLLWEFCSLVDFRAGEVKMLLHGHTGVPACQQLLSGWTRLPQNDATTLSSLSLPRENILFLSVPNIADGTTADDE